MEDASTYAKTTDSTPPPPLTEATGEGEKASLMQQALAGLPSDTNLRATFQGQSGYWCQADAVFIPSDWGDAAGAIWAYRHRLASGNIGVSHNLSADNIQLIRVLDAAATLRTRLQEAEDAKMQLAHDLLAEFYAGGELAKVDRIAKNKDIVAGVNAERGRNNAWVKMQCAELGIDFPPVQRQYASNLPAALPLQGEEGKGGQGE